MFMSLAERIRYVTASEGCVMVDPTKCSICGVCVENCPGSVFQVSDDHSRILTDSTGCFGCHLCLHLCPTGAVTVVPGTQIREI